ncbi:MAG: hypothetical protein GTN38_03100 [Candidatus Aenigmarchaeota archaeon]|nr:hypothetical protein [Candidatus Aenigmarchaeota archaeon]NIP40651.1 hypothetical protein [Candidatus Aenigmarchaeota archaeon]NIQ18457.1 hypothetical protein [Candidatus Aenigmarchaeota archaeon]NIS73356.1 hypothetical protein [Candidatus Aenigmarchaeota archaeon]
MKRDVLGFGIMLILFLLLFLSIPSITALTSTNGAFTVTPDFIYINWTNGTINLTSNSNNLTVVIDNSSTQIYSNYSQSGRYLIGSYKNLNDNTWNLCFNSSPLANQTIKFKVQNETGSHTTTSKTLDETNTTFFYLTPYMLCPPGKYYGYFYVENETNATENVKVNVSFQIPIDEENTFNITKNSGFFNGSMILNHGYYHSYYFNTSPTENLTGLTLRLGPSQSDDIDVFLYDSSGNFLSKSINRSSSIEEFVYDVPGTPEMYELRIYGNVSANYNGLLLFSTINTTNATGSEISSISFGELDANETSPDQVFVLKNEDDKVLTSVLEKKRIYHVDSWLNQGSNGTFRLLVPSFAERVKIILEWKNETGTDATNWTLFLRDVNGVLRGTSNSKHLNAKTITDSSVLEEYIEYTGSISESNDGFWNITVKKNQSGSLDSYNLTAYIYVPDIWIKTNYTTTNFSSSYSRPVNINITIPETSALNGSYEGFIEYYQASGWIERLPISFNVRTGMLIVNEELSLTSDSITHNTGFNTISSPLSIKIPYNNTGGYPLYINVENTTNNILYQMGNGSNYVDVVLSDFPVNPVNPGTSGFLNVSVKIDTSESHNYAGLYRGFVLFNTTNSTNVTRQSSLFKKFNITMYVNLTNLLNITVTNINPSLVHPPTSDKNVTFTVQVKLINGTIISNTNMMDYTNFTQIRMTETNVTTYERTLSNIVAGGTGGTDCSAGSCNINGTVPANSAGGKYNVHVTARWNTKMLGGTGEVNLTGTGVTDDFKVNDTGVKLTAVSNKDYGEVNEGRTNLYFNMTVKNYGPLAMTSSSKLRVYFHEGSCFGALTTDVKDSSHSYTRTKNTTGVYVDFEMSAYDAIGRWIRFEIDVANISETNKSCSMVISSANKKSFGAISGILLKIVEVAPSEDGNGQQAAAPTGCTSDSGCSDTQYCSNGQCLAVSCPDGFVSNHKCNPYQKKLSITDYESKIAVVQGEFVSTKVEVKNTGTSDLTVKFGVTHNITGVTQTIIPSSYGIGAGGKYKFTVNFTVSNTTKVGNHPITLKAYDKNNESTSTTKTIYLSVEPLEETKREINQTYEDYKGLFETLKSRFLVIQPAGVSDVNFTKTNRTYSSLLNMLDQVEEYLSKNQYADAADLLEDINSSLANFEAQIQQLLSEGSIFNFLQFGDIWTWAAIGVVIVVIVVFLVYLLLPPRKGYHPIYGYRAPSKKPIFEKLGKIVDRIKGVGGGVRKPKAGEEQTTLTRFEKMKKPYMEGYQRAKTFYQSKKGISEKLKKKVKK